MAINFKDARQKLADALRIQQTLTDVISTEERFITNTRASANKAKQSQVLEKLAQLDVEKLRDATEETIRVETLRKYGHNNIASIYHSSAQQLERIPGITGESAREVKSIADAMYTAIQQTISYGVDIKDLSPEDIAVITNLQALDKIRSATRGTTAKMKPVAETLNTALAKTAPLKSRVRWLFTNSDNKQKALDASPLSPYLSAIQSPQLCLNPPAKVSALSKNHKQQHLLMTLKNVPAISTHCLKMSPKPKHLPLPIATSPKNFSTRSNPKSSTPPASMQLCAATKPSAASSRSHKTASSSAMRWALAKHCKQSQPFHTAKPMAHTVFSLSRPHQ
jgi:hypothetical protein